MPRLMNSDAPSGSTSHSRTARNADGRSTDTVSRATAFPSSSNGCFSGSLSNVSDAASSWRWSPGRSAGLP